MSIRVHRATPRNDTPGGRHEASQRPRPAPGLVDVWEFDGNAFFPSRVFGGNAGVIVRISDSRWVSIGVSTNAIWAGPFDRDGGGYAYKYGATLWENQFDGELRRIQQVTLVNPLESQRVVFDTRDGQTWHFLAHVDGGATPAENQAVFLPTWQARSLTIDMNTGALSTGPLMTITYPDERISGETYGIASMSPTRALLFASIGGVNTTGMLWTVVLNMASGTTGATTTHTPQTLGWNPAPGSEGSTFTLTATSLSSSDALLLLFPLNVDFISSGHYVVVEAHFNASAAMTGHSLLKDLWLGEFNGLFASVLCKPQLNMAFVPVVTTGATGGEIDEWTSYSWINGVRQETPELTGYNTGSFLNPADEERFAYRSLTWYGDDQYDHGEVGQEQIYDLDDDYADWRLIEYPPRTVRAELDRVAEREFWFNTYTGYDGQDIESEYWLENVNDFVDESPGGSELFRYNFMLSQEMWCGYHKDTTGSWPSALGTPRHFIATWGRTGTTRRSATHESGTVRTQRGVL